MNLENVEIAIAVIGGFCAIIGTLLTFIMSQVLGSIRELTDNVALLNEKIAVTISRIDGHESRIIRLEFEKKGD